MSAGSMAKKMMNRVENHAPRRGHRLVASARNNPNPEKRSSIDSGANQTKCRLSMYSRLVGSMYLHRTLVPTSSNPPARPHHADRTSTSSAPSRHWPARLRVDPDEDMLRSPEIVVLTRCVLPGSKAGLAVVDDRSFRVAGRRRPGEHRRELGWVTSRGRGSRRGPR